MIVKVSQIEMLRSCKLFDFFPSFAPFQNEQVHSSKDGGDHRGHREGGFQIEMLADPSKGGKQKDYKKAEYHIGKREQCRSPLRSEERRVG